MRPDPGVTDLSTCAYVAQGGSEYVNGLGWLSSMTIEDANVIAASVGLVWAIAWGFKVIAKSLYQNGSSEHE